MGVECVRILEIIFRVFIFFPHISAIKDPPFVLKESGYAGFNLPIDIYFKGPTRDDTKKTTIIYDLNLQHTPVHNVEKFEYTFVNPAPDFRRKLLEAGGVPVNSMGQVDDKSRDASDDRSQLTSKPKLSSSESKKHKNRSTPDEPKPSSTFANLFGTPITKMSSSKVSPDQKMSVGNGNSSNIKMSNSSSSSKQPSQKSADKVSSKDKSEKSSRDKKDKSKRSSPSKEGSGKDSSSKKGGGGSGYDGREEKRKEKNHAKERDRSRDKSQKRPPSPKHMSRSPKRTPPRNSSTKDSQLIQKRDDEKPSSSSTKKSKKDKRDKDKDRERSSQKRDKESKHHSKDREERSSSKTSEKLDMRRDVGNNTPKEMLKEKMPKLSNDSKSAELPYDHPMVEFKSSGDGKKSDRSEKDSERKHKHKKKDKHKEKDRSGSKERKRDKDKSQKHKESADNSYTGTTSGIKSSSSNNLAMVAPAATTSKLNHPLGEMNDSDSSNSEVDSGSVSPTALASHNSSNDKLDVMDTIPTEHILPDVVATKHSMPTSSHASPHSPPPIPEYNSSTKSSDKASKRAAKEARAAEKEEKKRKRKARELEESHSSEEKRRNTPSPTMNGPPPKQPKKDESYRGQIDHDENELSPQPAIASNHVTSSSPSTSNAVYNDNFPSSSPSIATSSMAIEVHLSPIHTIPIEYMLELKELQDKIMALDDNNELQQVVEMIAATGCYEITTKTFDFDLCALDRVTVQRLQDFFANADSIL